MMKTIDVHSHILPGIDDGSQSVKETRMMLSLAAGQDVDYMIATPHFYAYKQSVEDFLMERELSYAKLSTILKDEYPEIIFGAEVSFFSGISRAKEIKKLTIEGTNILLLEMPFRPWTKEDIKEVKELINKRKLRIMIAHIERYFGIRGNRQKINEILELPVYVQVNAGSMEKWLTRMKIFKILKKKKVIFLGSDCHGIRTRIPNMINGRERLKKKLGDEKLAHMEWEIEKVILGGREDKEVWS